MKSSDFNGVAAAPPSNALRRQLVGGSLGIAAAMAVRAQNRTDVEPRTLNGQAVPEPPPERSAGPVKPGRVSALGGKVAVVTGAARGIGRAIAVEFAANGADVALIDIAGPVSSASNAVPATPEELEETVRQIKAYGRRPESLKADIRDINALRKAADSIQSTFGHIDIVVANAAIQRWKPLLEMEDSDWRDVIDNNLNGTPTPSVPSHRSWSRKAKDGSLDTALTRYEKRLTESMEETGQKAGPHPTPQQAWDVRAPTVPLHVGWLQPDDISPAAVFLASDAAAMVTGAEYEVTGGDSAKDI